MTQCQVVLKMLVLIEVHHEEVACLDMQQVKLIFEENLLQIESY